MKTSAKVDKKMSDFHSEDIEKEKSAYKMLQDAMIANQMPKFADATPADLQKKITVGSHRFSGEECYNALLKYKENIANLQAKVNSNNRSTTISSEDVSKLEKYILQMQQKLLQVEQILDDYVKYQDFYLAGKDIESFDLSHSQVSDFSEIDEKIKRQAEEFRIMADDILQGNIPVAIQSELNRPNINITGNDLR
ncbi:MAG: hypothetical protein LBU34_05205 [Planctomycetaceae bacterium]|nr:hypothetical protein [Planctomycetaceae bacterium]